MFIISALQKVPYLADCTPETLQVLAYSMKNENLESDRFIFGPGDRSVCMLLVYTGVIEISTKMDNGTEFILERCPRGTVINATSFLFEEPLELTARTVTPVSLYVIDKQRFLSVVSRDEKLLKRLEKELNSHLE